MVDRRLVAVIPDSAVGDESGIVFDVAGGLFCGSVGGPHCRPGAAETDEAQHLVAVERSFRHAGKYHTGFYYQPFRRGDGCAVCRRGLRRYLSAGGGEDLRALSLLSPRLLQRHLLTRLYRGAISAVGSRL